MLIMGPLDDPSLRRAADLDCDITAVSWTMLEALEAIDSALTGRGIRVHLKVDTGMGRWDSILHRSLPRSICSTA